MNTYVVVRSHWNKGDPLPVLDRVQAHTMEVKLEENGCIVIFRDDEARLIGVAQDFDAVYLEPTVELGKRSVPPNTPKVTQ